MTTFSRRFQRPFWPVSLVTGVLAFITLVILLVVYSQTYKWQYLALSGLGSIILLAHGLAWGLARAWGRFDLAIWLIAASQIVVSVFAPLFMADFWIIGLFLLLLVPIELGVADQPRRLPVFAIVTSLAAAGMVGVDLLDVPGRLRILVELPGAVFLSVGLLILHGSGLSFLLWHLRLRPKAAYYTPLDLATQLSMVFTGISAVSILVVTGVLVAQVRASQVTQVGQNFQTLAEMDAELVGNALEQQVNALAKVTQLTKVASLVGLLVLAGVVLVATVTARVITRPIEALTTTAVAIGEGDLEQCAQPVGPVELVTLAEAFNTLTARLRSLINSLQDQVDQRTAQLQARVEQLAALNRITQTVTSVHDLQAALEVVAREIVDLVDTRSTGIALLNEACTELTVMANYSRDENHPPSVGLVIPILGNPSSAQVVETGRSLVVTQAQTNPLTEPIHTILRERRTQCLMIVPLLIRGKVIGTIGVTTDQIGREFTPAEVRLVETVAGEIAGAVENVRLFIEMERAKEAAEAANEAKSAFLANVSHELRTPLTSILGFTKIIQKRLQDRIIPNIQGGDDKTRRAVSQIEGNIEIIIAESERLTALINNVLDLAKIEAGKMEWHMQPVAIAEVIDRAIASSAVLFEHKGLDLIKDVEEGLPAVVGDWDRLLQVVINLISNAVKFTEHGSVTCQARQIDGNIIVSVIDTGAGIAESDRMHVFEKFMQLGDTLTDKPQGTGLGLPICREIVEYHGGHIWTESALGQGSSFSFSLPIKGGD